jgi:hypothetical protein
MANPTAGLLVYLGVNSVIVLRTFSFHRPSGGSLQGGPGPLRGVRPLFMPFAIGAHLVTQSGRWTEQEGSRSRLPSILSPIDRHLSSGSGANPAHLER